MQFKTNQYASESKWFIARRSSPATTFRLFCFPYAGGGASIFRKWQISLPEEIEVVAVQLPGRENRFNEKPIGQLQALTQSLCEHIQLFFDKPFAFFGHSNGALICFELARTLQRMHLPLPEFVILSAKKPPHIDIDRRNISQLSDNDLIKELERRSGTPRELLQNYEFMQLLAPMLRADFELSENFIYSNDILLDSPTILFHGVDDEITMEQTIRWQELLLKPAEITKFSGGHFFINEQSEQVLIELNKIINNRVIKTRSSF
jgi:medium-chain acyl-[acyl-carrier-protein] hydrolase